MELGPHAYRHAERTSSARAGTAVPTVKTLLTVVLFTTFLPGCDLFDECSGDWYPTVFTTQQDVYPQMAVGETYTYELSQSLYVAEQKSGRHGCPVRNRRFPDVDSVAISDPSIVDAAIREKSVLHLRALAAGSANVEVFTSPTVVAASTGEIFEANSHVDVWVTVSE